MTFMNFLLLALTSVFVACNQFGVDPAILPYLVTLAALSAALAVLAVRKPKDASDVEADRPRHIVRQFNSPRERRV